MNPFGGPWLTTKSTVGIVRYGDGTAKAGEGEAEEGLFL